MRGLLNSNVMTVGAMGVLLLLASAVGRVTATNMTGWLGNMRTRAEHVRIAAPERATLAAYPSWTVR